MKSYRFFWVILFAIALCGWGFSREEGERDLNVKDSPAAVQQTVAKESKNATIRGFSEEEEGGKTVYELELLVDGRTRDMIIDQSGRVLEVEQQVDLASLPAPVKAAIVKAAGRGTIQVVESIAKGGKITVYEAQIVNSGKRSEVQVDPQGKVLH